MKYALLVLILIALNVSCTVDKSTDLIETENKTLTTPSSITEEDSSSKTNKSEIPAETPKEKEVPKYPGIAIDEKFGVLESYNSINIEKRAKGEKYSVDAGDFEVEFNNFAPKKIKKNNKSVLNIKTRQAEYAGFTVGVAGLLANNSKQIFLLGGTGGGVCCSVFWIFDTSNEKVRNIFRSEDYDYYRETMEVFDTEGDGIYELDISDSSFRYFMGDCGSCSPQPRAVFKYNERKKQYLPAKGIQQNFVKENFNNTEKWIAEAHEKIKTKTYEKLEREKDLGIVLNLHRTLLSHTVDLIYLGEEEKAWEIFNKYYSEDSSKAKTRAEIKKILRKSKFYQALKRNK